MVSGSRKSPWPDPCPDAFELSGMSRYESSDSSGQHLVMCLLKVETLDSESGRMAELDPERKNMQAGPGGGNSGCDDSLSKEGK